MHINILEDSIIQQQRLRQYLEELIQENNWLCHDINTYSRSEQLLQDLPTKGSHDVYFLDIEIKGSDKKGLHVAQAIRNKDPYATIIFVTTHSEFIALTFQYQVSALDFIDKSQNCEAFKERLKKCLLHIMSQNEQEPSLDLFKYHTAQAHFQIPFQDILYFETLSGSRQIVLVAKHKRIAFNGKMQDIENMDNRFFRSHRGFIVKIDNIEKIDKRNKVVVVRNHATCLISRRKIKALELLL